MRQIHCYCHSSDFLGRNRHSQVFKMITFKCSFPSWIWNTSFNSFPLACEKKSFFNPFTHTCYTPKGRWSPFKKRAFEAFPSFSAIWADLFGAKWIGNESPERRNGKNKKGEKGVARENDFFVFSFLAKRKRSYSGEIDGETGRVHELYSVQYIMYFRVGFDSPTKLLQWLVVYFPYKYDVISPTHIKEVFYSPTPIMAVPLNTRCQFPHTLQTSGHLSLLLCIQCSSFKGVRRQTARIIVQISYWKWVNL